MIIRWSIPAKADYDENIAYLLDEWTEEVALDFVLAVDHTLMQITQQPYSFPETDHKGVRGGPLIPQISVFYRVFESDGVIELIRFWNNYKDPQSLSL